MADVIQDITYKEIDKAEDIDLDEVLTFKHQIKELITPHYLKFLFKPNAEDETLKLRDFKLNKNKSKRNIYRRIKSPLTYTGLAIVFFVVTWAVFAPWIARYAEVDLMRRMQIEEYTPPSSRFWFGTGNDGQDVYSRLIWGARSSLTLGLGTIAISVVFGVIFGTISAYQGGIVDSIIMRLVDIIMAFPGLILLIIILSMFENTTIELIMLIMGVLGIPGYARLMRGSVLQEKQRIYVEAAKVSGASTPRVMFRHVLPNAITPILISVTGELGGIILSLAGLAFLGFGASNKIEWGYDINKNKGKLYVAPWSALWPGVGIILSVLGFMLLGDGLRDALDPRSKA